MSGDKRVQRLIRPAVLSAAAYRVPDAEGLVKLDAMENPYIFPESLRGQWLERLRRVDLNRYPDAAGRRLKDLLRRAFAVPDSAGVLLGNGSDEIIQMICLALARTGAVVMAPEPSFVMYEVCARIAGMEFVGVPLDGHDFSLDLPAMEKALELHRPAVVFLAWPNNPTGTLLPRADLKAVITQSPGIIVVDEAYYAYSGHSCLNDLERHDNLLVLRTLSKLGMAGLRLGFLAGRNCWLEQLEKLRPPYNVGSLTQASAEFFLEHLEVFEDQVKRVCAERDRLTSILAAMPGITVWPSSANFLLFRVADVPASTFFERLKEKGVLIKLLDGVHPALEGCLRVTIGTPEENETFAAAMAAAAGV